MLEELRISSLGVIEEASLDFGPGLNVVTGETGAGKTMVVTALGLLLGARADSATVRQGLLVPSRQRDCLDAFGGQPVTEAAAAFSATYRRLHEVQASLQEILASARQRAQEADLLRLGLDEIAAAAPTPGEDEALLA